MKKHSIIAKSLLLSGSMALTSSPVLAKGKDGADIGIGGIASNVNTQLKSIATLVGQVAFVAGMLFFVAGIFKFKQHKDNPTQVPVGTPLTMIVISAALMFMGNFITPLGQTLFGTDAKAGSTASDLESGFGSGSSNGSNS